jgi:hypothetical protein
LWLYQKKTREEKSYPNIFCTNTATEGPDRITKFYPHPQVKVFHNLKIMRIQFEIKENQLQLSLRTSLSATGITRCSAWVHLWNIHNYTAYHQLQGLNTDLVYFGIKEKKGVNIEKQWGVLNGPFKSLAVSSTPKSSAFID